MVIEIGNKCLRALMLLCCMTYLGVSLRAQTVLLEKQYLISDILEAEVPYNVLLPEAYHKTGQCYPLVFLLHGFNGNEDTWLKAGRIKRIVDSLERRREINPAIYILPNGNNSYYINNYDGSYRYSDFFIQELVPAIDSIYRTCTEREYRTLMGMSMGGYGSIVLGVLAPQEFGNIIALSPAVRTMDQFTHMKQKRYDYYFPQVYGPGLNGKERITAHWLRYSPYFRIKPPISLEYRNLNWIIFCGSRDALLPSGIAFSKLLNKNGIEHYFRVTPGGHTWIYWRRATVEALLELERVK